VSVIKDLTSLSAPTPWPGANARLLGLGMGLPVKPLDRLAQFSANDFERFTLEWASGYLTEKVPDVYEVQQRGGSGDKGRDIVVWLDPPDKTPRRWRLYQCKHYDARLGAGVAAAEIGKVLHYTLVGDYSRPEEYWFVTHQGVTGPLQDLLDDPDQLKSYILINWEKYCSEAITSKAVIALTQTLRDHIKAFPFSIFRAKQPQALLDEHAQVPRYHLPVFGAPLIDRPKPPLPPSSVAATETVYVGQLLDAISAHLGTPISTPDDVSDATLRRLFERSRITFYCAEGLKELARDQMADTAYFDTLLDEFGDGLYHVYTDDPPGLPRLKATVKAAQEIQLGGHVLAPHVKANDREGMCHHLANETRLTWCGS
jgi:hypothetical protein